MIRALYVDDEPSLLEICRMYLEMTGEFEVTTAPSVLNGLEALKKIPFDVIISDYQIPEMDGIEFLKLLRGQGDVTPFILFTGRGREDIIIEAINNGADFYLQKGGDPRAQFAELAHKAQQAVRRRQAEVSLKESERRYREVVKTQTEFISSFRPDGTLVFVNDAYCRHFGKSRDQIVGCRFIPGIHADDRERLRRHFTSFSPANPEREIEHRVIMPDGSMRWHWWNDHAFFNDEGEVTEFQSIGKDITTRKQAEEALRESESRWRQMLEHSPVPMALFRLDGTALLFNRQFERIVGWTVADIPHLDSWWSTVYHDTRYREQERETWLGSGTRGDRRSWQRSFASPNGSGQRWS